MERLERSRSERDSEKVPTLLAIPRSRDFEWRGPLSLVSSTIICQNSSTNWSLASFVNCQLCQKCLIHSQFSVYGFSLKDRDFQQKKTRLIFTYTAPMAHCFVLKLLKMSHLVWEFWNFPTIFVQLKLTCLVTLFDRKLHFFKNSLN